MIEIITPQEPISIPTWEEFLAKSSSRTPIGWMLCQCIVALSVQPSFEKLTMDEIWEDQATRAMNLIALASPPLDPLFGE